MSFGTEAWHEPISWTWLLGFTLRQYRVGCWNHLNVFPSIKCSSYRILFKFNVASPTSFTFLIKSIIFLPVPFLLPRNSWPRKIAFPYVKLVLNVIMFAFSYLYVSICMLFLSLRNSKQFEFLRHNQKKDLIESIKLFVWNTFFDVKKCFV